MTIHLDDYHVITSLLVGHPYRWSWEICRKSTPLGIKMTGDGYQSDTAAQFAGQEALAVFLSALAKEEKRPSQYDRLSRRPDSFDRLASVVSTRRQLLGNLPW